MEKPKVPEPWLRGTLTDVPPVQRAVLHALELAKEDLERWCDALIDEELNARLGEIAPIAFHIRHSRQKNPRPLRRRPKPPAHRRPPANAHHRRRTPRPRGRPHPAPRWPGNHDRQNRKAKRLKTKRSPCGGHLGSRQRRQLACPERAKRVEGTNDRRRLSL